MMIWRMRFGVGMWSVCCVYVLIVCGGGAAAADYCCSSIEIVAL